MSINGDGGFMFTAMEMATAAQHGIGVVAVVFSDGAYGNASSASSSSRSTTGTIASDLRNPDFVKLGESFGLHTERVKSPEELSTAISRGIARGGPVLIDCPVGELPDPWSIVQVPRNRPAKAHNLSWTAEPCSALARGVSAGVSEPPTASTVGRASPSEGLRSERFGWG